MENKNLASSDVKESVLSDMDEKSESAAEILEVGSEQAVKSQFIFSKSQMIMSFILVAIVFVVVYFFSSSQKHVAIKQFASVYSFVPEKISKSAAIPISVPEGVDEMSLRNSISFSPEIKGSWRVEEEDGVAVFEPKEQLRSGVYYAVNLDTGSIQMSGDFYVDEDPKIQAIFPGEGTESHEDSEITIVFNRPMVPLTALSEQEMVELPITITPLTPGKFKWISTRNLQFIPETTLIPSSDYSVKIDEGLFSIDGLPVAPVVHSFVTRPLRYEYVPSGQVGYRSPIIVSFNQPVDLEKTKQYVSVSEYDGGGVSIEIEYGETTHYDHSAKKYVSEPDQSKLFIYKKKDKHGRSRFWDFDTKYKVSIDGAMPLFGNKNLNEGNNSVVSVPNIVQSVKAESERSSSVRPDLLDPQGFLIVNFYEDIELSDSNISVKGMRSIEYGQRCKVDEDGRTVQLGSGCEEEPDKSTIKINFNQNAFTTNEAFTLELKKIVTPDGLKINADTIKIPLRTYPELSIYRTAPSSGVTNAPLEAIYICSNTPLNKPGDEGVSEYIKTNGYIVYGQWYSSRYINNSGYNVHCRTGEFQTQVDYGLLPETDYSLTLSLVDNFGQTAEEKRSFTTTQAGARYAHFFNMQKQYNVTPSNRTTLTYAVENLEYLDMHICRLEPESFLDRITYRTSYESPAREDGCTEIINKRIDLPKRYWVYNYFQVNLADYFTDTRGQYVITFSNPLLQQSYSKKMTYERTYVSVTNLTVGKKEVEFRDDAWGVSDNQASETILDRVMTTAKNLYWVNQSQSLLSVSEASVSQYIEGENENVVKISTDYTDGQGVARAKVGEGVVGAVVRSGLDTAVVTDWADNLKSAGRVRDASRTYVYTDRPIYRPGQTVYIKGIDRIGFDGDYEIWNEEPVTLEVFDSKEVSLYEVDLMVNDYGTFNTEFQIPEDSALGTYRINVLGQAYQFSVEEYVPAAFKLETETNKEEYINGDTMKIEVQADYYFGVPLSEGTVAYSVTAQDYYFDRYTDEYFSFGQSWYYCYSCGYGDDFLFRGEVDISENGKAVISRDLKFEDYFDDVSDEQSKLVTVWITAKDVNGRSVATQKSFVVHKADFYIGSKTGRYFTGVNTALSLRVKTVDLDGEERSLKDIDRTVYKVSWENYKRQEVDGGFYYRSEKKLEEISSEKIKTDAEGDWSGEILFDEEGQYEIHISKKADNGVLVKSISTVYVYGSQSVSVPPKNNYELDIELERSDLSVGDTASLLIKAPYDKAKVLISVERGSVYDYWIADVTGGLYMHEFPIKSEYAPNVFVSVLLLSGDPEVKFGNIRLDIDSEEHNLDVSVVANKTHYLPGEKVTLSVETKDYTGRFVPAEVSVAVADLSVLALKGNPKKNPAVFFFDGFPLSVTTASNIKNILYETDIPIGTKGGGGSDPDDLSKKKRGVFKDTAFWEATVVTDQSGKAAVSFTLPDNLTTWQIESLGVTKDTKLGVDYTEFTTKKDLMAVPLKPRFVVPGDVFFLGAKVFNQTDRGREVAVELESETLSFVDGQTDSVFVNEGESKTIYFQVVAPKNMRAGEHVFTFTASDDSFVDSVEQSISITPNLTYETTATANFTKEDRAVEYLYIPDEVLAGAGGLTVNANATLAVFMSDALSYMVTYPYGCSEQLASSLSTIAILTSALDLLNVEGELDAVEYDGVTYKIDDVVNSGLGRIYENQTSGGGFSYYKNSNPSLWLTMHVVTALSKLEEAGFGVRGDVIARAAEYIESESMYWYRQYPNSRQETLILAEYVLRTAAKRDQTKLSALVGSLVDNDAFLNEKISSMSLAYLSILSTKGYAKSQQDRVYNALKNRIDMDGRGAYLSSIDTVNRSYYEHPIKNTSLLLKVFAAQNDEHPAMANVLRWLLASRDNYGAWGGTHNTFYVVDGMVDYLKWQKETESHFTLKALLGGQQLFEHEFSQANVFEKYTHFTSIDSLQREKMLKVEFSKESLNGRDNNLYYDMSLKYFLPVESLPPRDEGITITRGIYDLDDVRDREEIDSAKVGDVVRGKLTITIPEEYTHVSVEDVIPAGFELVNFNLSTEDRSLLLEREDGEAVGKDQNSEKSWWSGVASVFSGSQSAQIYRPNYYGGSYDNLSRKLIPTHVESHDDRVFLYVEKMSPGVYEYEYFLRALVPGEFQHMPARAEELFFPEVFGRTEGGMFSVTEES